jgi:hypothetical protein
MIKNILDLLPYVEDGSENIRIAKGKNYLQDMQWLKQ